MKMKRIICISTGNFYARVKGTYGLKGQEMNKIIKLCSKMDIDGVEILISNLKEFLKFRFSPESIRILRNYKFNTIHAPFGITAGKKKEPLIFSRNRRCKKALERIYWMYNKINAKNINFHPQQIKNFGVFDVKNYNHSIENMEGKDSLKLIDYKKILNKNKGFGFVLDTTHAGESGEINALLEGLRNKIIYAHLSANYFNHLHMPLHTLKDEYLKNFEVLKKEKFPIVIECQIGSKELYEYKREVDFIRKWLK